VYSINMRGGARGGYTPTHHQVKTLAATSSSQPNTKTLAAREVLTHPCVVFHPYTCELHGGAVAVATVLISYDNLGLLP
jgi:hypothetical protein